MRSRGSEKDFQACYKFQVAENIKEFFHNEGIHSTTIQPEFVDYQPTDGNGEDCVLICPKGPGALPAPNCEASKCCKPPTTSNGNLKRSSRSAQNTPTTGRRPTSFTEQEVASISSSQLQSDETFPLKNHEAESKCSASWSL